MTADRHRVSSNDKSMGTINIFKKKMFVFDRIKVSNMVYKKRNKVANVEKEVWVGCLHIKEINLHTTCLD